MKLVAHNFISSRFLKNVKSGYPMILRANDVTIKDLEFDANHVISILPKLDYSALRTACISLNEAGKLPESVPDNWIECEEFLKELHRVLFCVEIIDGELECPDTGIKFAIKNGIPNLLPPESEKED